MDNMDLGMMMLLTTFLGSRVICGLEWKDFKINDDYGIGYLMIYRALSADGKEYKNFNRIEMCRLYPCYHQLTVLLESERKKCEQEYKDKYLNESIISWRRKTRITPAQLDAYSKNVITELDINENEVELLNDDQSFFTGPASKRQLYISNFRYWAKECGLTDDEISYLSGNKASSTLARHYRDFKNPGALYVLSVKTERVVRKFFCQDHITYGNIKNIDEKINTGNNKSRRNITMSFVTKSKNLDVTIESNGSFFVIAEVNNNENR